jgi:hypothetical protein
VKRTSPIFKIAVCKDNISEKVQDIILKEASTIIMEDFVELNKTVIQED